MIIELHIATGGVLCCRHTLTTTSCNFRFFNLRRAGSVGDVPLLHQHCPPDAADFEARSTGNKGYVDDSMIAAAPCMRTEGGETTFDKFLENWANLGSDEAYFNYLEKNAYNFTSDGGGNLEAGLDMSKYPDAFLSTMSTAAALFYYDFAIQIGLGAFPNSA